MRCWLGWEVMSSSRLLEGLACYDDNGGLAAQVRITVSILPDLPAYYSAYIAGTPKACAAR